MSNNMKKNCRVVVLGAASVGKSCLVSQFLFDRFITEYKETVEDFHRKNYNLNGIELILDIIDTSGAYNFPAMRRLAIASGDAFVLVYSVDDESSFEEVTALREQILMEKNNDRIPIVIVGNKADVPESQREVKREIVESVVAIDWESTYVEASAKDNVNVNGIFQDIVSQVNTFRDVTQQTERRRFSVPLLSAYKRQHKPQKRHSSVS